MPLVAALLPWALALPATHAGAATVSAAPDGGGHVVIRLTGRIGAEDDAALASALRRAGRAGTPVAGLALSSPGGDAAGALRIAMRVVSTGLATRVDAGGTCASACFIVFAAGRPRSVGPGAVLGVHRVAVGGRDAPRGKPIDDRLAVVLRDLGTPGNVVAAMLSTPPDGLYVLDGEDLRTMGVDVTE